MKISVRDRWILAFLPGLFLLIGYQYGVAGPLTKSVAALRESAANVDPNKASQDLNAALRDAHKAEVDLENEKKTVVQSESVFPEEWKDSDRTRTLQQLSQLFEDSGVQLLGSNLQTDRAVDGALQELAKGLQTRYGAPAPQLWKFELTGTYSKFTQMLKLLGASKRFIVPVSVDMKVEDDSSDLTWTVHLWI